LVNVKFHFFFFREHTREQQDRTVLVQNQKEKSGFLSWISKKVLLWHNPVSQCSFADCDASVKSYKIIHTSVIARSVETPYIFKFHDPVHIITGIACVPKDAKTSSPEAEVIRGGIGFKEVEIVLTPVEKRDWCCCVQIFGIEENHPEINSVPN